jgi:tetratricopeptide (TPR) repeat protein
MRTVFLAIICCLGSCLPALSNGLNSDLDCNAYTDKLKSRLPNTADASYLASRKAECDLAKNGDDIPLRVMDAQFYVGQAYENFGEYFKASSLYLEAIGMLRVDDAWKIGVACSTAAMAAGALAGLPAELRIERAKWALRSATWGIQTGSLRYAEFLERGDGVVRDYIEAYAWYNVVSSYSGGYGEIQAKEAMARLEQKLPIESQLKGQALAKEILGNRDATKGCRYLVD